MFQLQVDVKKGVDPAKVEAAIADEWAEIPQGRPDRRRARARQDGNPRLVRPRAGDASTARRRSSPKARSIAAIRARTRKTSRESMAATPAERQLAAANKWIAQGRLHADGAPCPKARSRTPRTKAKSPAAPRPTAAGAGAAAQGRLPHRQERRRPQQGRAEVGSFPDLSFPKLERGKLKNGIEVILAERHTMPVVQMQLLFDAGYASDQGRKLGTSSFTMAMLDEGTKSLDSLEIAQAQAAPRRDHRQRAAGSTLQAPRSTRWTSQLKPSLALFADIVRNPAFRDDDIARLRGQWLAAHRAGKDASRTGIALRTLPPLLYGEGHAYAIPFTGSGTEASIKALTAGRPARVRRRLPASGQREDPGRRRHHAGRRSSRSSTRRSATGRRRPARCRRRTSPRSQPPPQAARVPGRPARRAADR